MMSFDPRYSGSNPPCTSRMVQKSLFLHVLPQLEQSALFNSINHGLTIFGHENRTVCMISVATFACPSDPGAGQVRSGFSLDLYTFGFATASEPFLVSYGSYVGIYGSFYLQAIPTPGSGCLVPPSVLAQVDGSFNDRSPIAFSSFLDGTSTTAVVAERRAVSVEGRCGRPWRRLRPLRLDDLGQLGRHPGVPVLSAEFVQENLKRIPRRSLLLRIEPSSGGFERLDGRRRGKIHQGFDLDLAFRPGRRIPPRRLEQGRGRLDATAASGGVASPCHPIGRRGHLGGRLLNSRRAYSMPSRFPRTDRRNPRKMRELAVPDEQALEASRRGRPRIQSIVGTECGPLGDGRNA